jgi:DNA repair photolyase
MKSGTIGEKVCPYCYAEEYDGYYPNLSEDEWDR